MRKEFRPRQRRGFPKRIVFVCILVHPWFVHPRLMFGEVLDRIAVTVDKQVITLGDIVRELRVDAFLDRKPVDLSADTKRQAARRLVDQILILGEAADSHLTLATLDDAGQMISQVKAQYATDQEYRAALSEYRVTEMDLSQHLLDGLQALRFTDLRFRPQVQLSDSDLRAYYDDLASGWRKAGRAQIPTFDQSRTEVEKLLTDQRIMQGLDGWLDMQRSSKQIQYREAAFQ